MKNKLTYLFILCVFGLTACASTDIVHDVRVEVISPPDALLTEVFSEPPPDISRYVSLRWIDKEEILVDLYRAQTTNLNTANEQLKAIREWKEKTIKLYEKRE